MADDATADGTSSEASAAEFPDLSAAEAVNANAPSMELIRDIPVELTVQLGRTEMLIEEVMSLTPGQ